MGSANAQKVGNFSLGGKVSVSFEESWCRVGGGFKIGPSEWACAEGLKKSGRRDPGSAGRNTWWVTY